MNDNLKMKITAEAKDGRGYIRITDVLHPYSETGSAAAVRLAVDSFLNQNIRKASIYISSKGGDVFEGEDIANELDRLDEVELILGATACSAVTKLVAKYYTTAQEGTKIMIHWPKLSTYGSIDKIEGDLKLLKDISNDYVASYAKKMGISAEDVTAILNKGDVWYTAKEALDNKLINAINQPKETPKAAYEALITAVAIDEKTHEDDKKLKMDRIKMIAALGLAADATDEQILDAAKKAKDNAQKLADIKAKEDAELGTRAKALIAKAVVDKKIKPELVATYEALANADYEGTKKAIEAMTAIPKLSAELDGTAEGKIEARKDWNFDKWQEEDPMGLQALAETEPERFDKLFKGEKI
ncbi:MAG: ATP-dependent Clp protease proteolytic subunit [Sphingobacteriales bacterium]|nr:ATP-dependent Clp protease proteolytic subunit [Sphingobacteriales bacterium]